MDPKGTIAFMYSIINSTTGKYCSVALVSKVANGYNLLITIQMRG